MMVSTSCKAVCTGPFFWKGLQEAGNVLANWQSEIEIESFNTISRDPYQKDYDAIVDVWVEDHTTRFALEYERT